ncbi:hypothetical protein JQN72_06010 [Phycicoccus sp. CSK15P-2]|uniref:hypothetical protein n=1 Tax=Phycicoccus sp. CSK15P-2 TaxID=2807627 RepID=UPI0019520FC3|nr:hypothetical protein [Phycicoccus sp. CSK15P-2]MBM6403795.1 hypothetical protein [Phycicoccus sp. CSK15P-2]
MTAIPAGGGRAGRRAGLTLLLLSLLLGLGVAFAAAAVIVSSNGPGDSSAVSDGPNDPLPAGQLLGYGG